MGFVSQRSVLIIGILMCCLSSQIGARSIFGTKDVEKRPPALEQVLLDAMEDSEDLSFFFDLDRHLLKTEYDIILTQEEYKDIMSPSGRQKRTAGIYPNSRQERWTNKTLNYEFDPNFNPTERDMNEFLLSLNDWSQYTCIKFEENQKENRIRVKNDRGCYSMVGMSGGVQPLSLGQGCRYQRTIMHEFGHAIGIHHEQTRPDRDDHVTIRHENIHDQMVYNFDKYGWHYIMDLGIDYDYHSIMHYSNRAFSKNGGITIETKDPKYANIIGRVQKLSFGDIKTANLMYKCGAEKGCTKKDSDCPGTGFVGKDCTCWCPGSPATHCYEKDDQEKGPLTPTCTDLLPYSCPKYAEYGYCTEYESYMSKNCAKSCKMC